MWRKPAEEKPPSQASEVPIAESVTPDEKSGVPEPAPSPAPELSPVAAQPQPVAPQTKVVPSTVPLAANVVRETSRITSGLKINGEVSGDTDLYIDGDVQGNIRLPAARVCVGPQGSVKADIEAREIVIEGMAQGTLKAAENIHLGPSSRVQGSILAPRIGIEDGARLRGKVDMTRTGSSPDLSAPGNSPDPELSRSASAGVKV